MRARSALRQGENGIAYWSRLQSQNQSTDALSKVAFGTSAHRHRVCKGRYLVGRVAHRGRTPRGHSACRPI